MGKFIYWAFHLRKKTAFIIKNKNNSNNKDNKDNNLKINVMQ